MPRYIAFFQPERGRRVKLGSCSAETPAEALKAIRDRNPDHPANRFAVARDFDYSPWRHGGWYTNVRHPSGACGCVSRNYPDGKWRIVCDPRPDAERPTFRNRDDAAQAEADLIASRPELYPAPRA